MNICIHCIDTGHNTTLIANWLERIEIPDEKAIALKWPLKNAFGVELIGSPYRREGANHIINIIKGKK